MSTAIPTASATRAAPESGPAGAEPLAGTSTLIRLMLRRDRVKLPVWVGGIGLDAPTLERVVANGYGLYLLVLAALMSILLVVRHTRGEEPTGRAGLLRANVVGRHAALTAALAVAVITTALAGLVTTGAMIAAGGFGTGGSLLLGAAVTATGLAFAGIAAVSVQLTEYSRTATSVTGTVLGLAFVVRAAGDMAHMGGTALSWLSPLGWAQQTGPFVLDRWWPLVLLIALAAVGAAAGYALSTRRDLGASMVAARPGPSRARPRLGTPAGLALRLQRASILGWAIGLAVTGTPAVSPSSWPPTSTRPPRRCWCWRSRRRRW